MNRHFKLLASIVIISLVFFTGCELLLESGEGSLVIQLRSSSREVTWIPDISMDIVSYTISGTGPSDGDSFTVSDFTEDLFVQNNIAVGEWEIIIDGFNSNGDKIASTTINTIVRKRQTSVATATMRPLSGSGTLDISVSWTDSQMKLADPKVFITVRDASGEDLPVLSTPRELTIDEQSAIGSVENIAVGWYEVTVGLYEGLPDSDPEIVWQGVFPVRIVKDHTTEGRVYKSNRTHS